MKVKEFLNLTTKGVSDYMKKVHPSRFTANEFRSMSDYKTFINSLGFEDAKINDNIDLKITNRWQVTKIRVGLLFPIEKTKNTWVELSFKNTGSNGVKFDQAKMVGPESKNYWKEEIKELNKIGISKDSYLKFPSISINPGKTETIQSCLDKNYQLIILRIDDAIDEFKNMVKSNEFCDKWDEIRCTNKIGVRSNKYSYTYFNIANVLVPILYHEHNITTEDAIIACKCMINDFQGIIYPKNIKDWVTYWGKDLDNRWRGLPKDLINLLRDFKIEIDKEKELDKHIDEILDMAKARLDDIINIASAGYELNPEDIRSRISLRKW